MTDGEAHDEMVLRRPRLGEDLPFPQEEATVLHLLGLKGLEEMIHLHPGPRGVGRTRTEWTRLLLYVE